MTDDTAETWLRDFSLLGLGVGIFSPLALFGAITYEQGLLGVVLALHLGMAFGGCMLGALAGALLRFVHWLLPESPLLLSPLGFPVGGFIGAILGGFIGATLHAEAIPVIGGLGFVTAGCVLGFTWLPYLALRLAGRSGLPVIGLASVCSSLVGIVAFASMNATGLFT